MKWECLAITLFDYQEFLGTLSKTKDGNEKVLLKRLTDEVLPVIEKIEEDQRRKIARKEKELFDLQKLATAKRSSRLADKHEKAKQEQEAAEAKRKYEADLAEALKEQARKEKMEQDRQSRMMTREQRIKDREQKRLLHEREVQMIAEKEKELENGESHQTKQRKTTSALYVETASERKKTRSRRSNVSIFVLTLHPHHQTGTQSMAILHQRSARVKKTLLNLLRSASNI